MKKNNNNVEGFSEYIELNGSAKKGPEESRQSEIDKTKPITITLLLRSKAPFPSITTVQARKKFKQLTHRHLWTAHGPLPSDIEKVESFAHHYNLIVIRKQQNRIVQLRGSVLQMEEAFKVKLSHYLTRDGHQFIGRSGAISVPKSLEGIVQGVFGLDSRPMATPKFKINTKKQLNANAASNSSGFAPNQLATLYNFPVATGKGQVIAMIELGGGYRSADVTSYFNSLGMSPPHVISVSVDDGYNNPTTASSADAEVMLDIEVAGAIAPNASIVVYFAPNTDQGFLDAIASAVHDTKYKPDIISISWGAAEINWTAQSLNAFNEVFQEAAALGITVCAAAGDQGSSDGVADGLAHVDFPASSPYVLSCGGTSLTASETSIEKETVWHDAPDSATGGGISDFFVVPSYQAKTNLPVSVNSGKQGRGVPDVAGDADPETGYRVLVDGEPMVIGGTSAVAPLMSGLIARINEKKKKNVGYIHPLIYGSPSSFRDIVSGDNITAANNKGYKSTSGWDACTGLGVPNGQNLVGVL